MDIHVDTLIRRFVSGEDTSIQAANRIETALDEAYPDDGHVQETVEALARYRPGGGPFLFDVAAVRDRLAATLSYLREADRSR